MPLPKIDLPVFELKLVSLSNPVRFRPFLVKEEKLLLMALQDGDEETVFKTIKQIINNCLVDEVDIDKLPIFDIEYLFLNLRARSIGEKIETLFMCRNIVGKEKDEEGIEQEIECHHMMPIKIDVLQIKPPISDLSTKIHIHDKIGIVLKFPTLKTMKPITELISAQNNDRVFDMLYECTDYVFDQNGMYYANETPKDEFIQFLESLTQEQFDRITEFFEKLPKIQYDVENQCEKCGFQHSIHMEGLTDFFI